MALATRCPACDTVFRISTAQAAAKGGNVRCGHCRHAFNSLDALVRVEDLDVLDETSVALPDPPVTVVPVDKPAPVDAEPVPVERPMSEWWLPEPGERRAPRTASEIDPDLPTTGAGQRGDPGPVLATDLDRPAPAIATSATFMRPETPVEPAPPAVRWLFAGLALLALVVLLGQAAYLWRDELAVRWSPARPWLAAACVPLRCSVDYPAHLDAITIESAAVQPSGAPDVYVLTALLRNRDSIDIRYPHLELVLTDVQDRPILRRALRPEDYLSPDQQTNRPAPPGFAAGSELPVRVMFQLSDLRFTGYRLDRFYP